ncbi:MAG: hypothetical protein ACE5I8_00365 [Thermodesulfobacteriota bacterium]
MPTRNEREASEIIDEKGGATSSGVICSACKGRGEASHVDIGARLRVSSAYAEYICNSLVKRGYLEKVGRNLYVLTPDCEEEMEKRAEKEKERA